MTGFRHGPNMDSSANNADHLNQLTKVNNMKNATIITAALATLLTTGLMSGNAVAGATVCKDITIKVEGSSAGGIAKFRQRRAERRAKKAWAKEAKAYGPAYNSFSKAININVDRGFTGRGNPKVTITADVRVCI